MMYLYFWSAKSMDWVRFWFWLIWVPGLQSKYTIGARCIGINKWPPSWWIIGVGAETDSINCMSPYKGKTARISHGNSRLGCKGETGNVISPPQSLYLSCKGFVSTEWQIKTGWKDTFWSIFEVRHCVARLSFTRNHLVPERGPHLFLPHSQTEPATLNLHPNITGHWHLLSSLSFTSGLKFILLSSQVISYVLSLDPVQRHLKKALAKVLS